MKHYTVKEYIKRYNQRAEEKYMNDYVLSLSKKSQLSEMIEFKDPEFLAGAFSGKFGLLTITNFLKYDKKELKTQAEDLKSYLSYSEGYYSFDKLISPGRKEAVFISGFYDKKTGKPLSRDSLSNHKDVHHFFVEKLDDRTLTLNHPYIEEHKREKTEFRNSDVLKSVLDALKNNKVEDVIYSIERTLDTMKDNTKGFFNCETEAYATYEKPYRLHVTGTDDSSWSMCYATMEEVNEVRKEILLNPSSETIDKYLVFTN